MDADGDKEGRDFLLRDNGEALKRIHEEYCRRASRGPSDEELRAWDYLTGKQEVQPAEALLPSILGDRSFRDVIRRGSHEGTYQFVSTRLEEIQEMLKRRLDVRLSPDHVMLPEEKVYNQRSAQRGQLDPRFVEAREFLKSGDYGKASVLFDRLADRVEGIARDICRNFQAYALAKQDEPLQARRYLFDLSKAGFRYPSAHWNLACCLLAEQMGMQLDALAKGLDCAPHPRLLEGAVYLGLLLDDSRLREWLPWLTLIEALLLAYHLDFENMTARERAVQRLGQYLIDGEPVVLDPTSIRLPMKQMTSYLNTLLERSQEPAFEFWLRCRETVAKNQYEYWEIKSDFLERTQRRVEAAAAFRDELRNRLKYITSRQEVSAYVIATTARRAEQWLRQCMTPQLRQVGHDIYNMISQCSSPLRKQLLTRAQQVHEYYGTKDEQENEREPVEVKSTIGGARKPSLPDLNSMLARIGAECHAQFHDVSDLSQVRGHLGQLAEGLRMQNKQTSADTLLRLLQEWGNYSGHKGSDDREAALHAAQTAYAEFRGALQRDLSQEQWLLAAQLLSALQRVNGRLARAFDLLPKLTIEPVKGPVVVFDPEVGETSFPLRIRSKPGSVPVRIKKATAVLDDSETEFTVRDKLDKICVAVSPDESAILTFEKPPGFRVSGTRRLRIEISYEYAGDDFTSPPLYMEVAAQSCRPLSTRSPYIFGRALTPHEIEEHFFGREREQEIILESVNNGQQRLRYIEGIRRSGKTSLLRSIEYEINKRLLPLIPVYVLSSDITGTDHAGRMLFNLLEKVAKNKAVSDAGVALPDEERCCTNPARAYSEFQEELSRKLQDRRVLGLLDDFQVLVDIGNAARESSPSLTAGIVGLLNLLWGSADPSARLLWVLAGHRAFRQYRELLPGVLMWGTARALPIDFLDQKAVSEIVTKPLLNAGVLIPAETTARVHCHTSGHPEVVQQLAEIMFQKAVQERRDILTPSDADDAAEDLASSSDFFADTWYPLGELSKEQRELMAAFVNAVAVGGRIEPHRLVPGNQLTERIRGAIDDLAARKIVESDVDGTIGVKARVLDLWLHRKLPAMITEAVNGSVAVFIDVANLTAGTGNAVLIGLETKAGEGVPGRFTLTTVIKRLETYARSLTPAPIAARWVVNYPRKSPAVVECNAEGYQVENIPEELFEKGRREPGADDVVLIEKISDVERGYSTVNHFVLVAGDKGYFLTVERLLKNGKFVHVVSRAGSLAAKYDYLARRYPDRVSVTRLEELLEGEGFHR
ncbi:MAG: NYN domain-containing protein [Gammaproteobacteria bacterium]